MQLLPLLVLVLAPLPFSRESDGSGPRRSDEELEKAGWILLDGVIAQAGDEVVTLNDLDQFLTERLGPDATPEVARSNAPRALQTLEMIRLETQAGEDLGIPREEIERMVQANLNDQRKSQGVLKFRSDLASQGLDPRAAVDSQSRELYRIAWTREQLGRRGLGGRRTWRDSYLRPGTLRAFYHENQDFLGDPPQVRFQRLFIHVKPDETTAEAESRAKDIIDRLGQGESFDDLLLDLGEEDPIDSLQPWRNLPDLAQDDPEVAAFARSAPEGSIYPKPLPAFTAAPSGPSGSDQTEPVGWFIFRLNDRLAGSPPPFESRETQKQLRQLLSRQWDDGAMTRARRQLEATSYHWRHPRFGGAPAPQLAGPPAPTQQR